MAGRAVRREALVLGQGRDLLFEQTHRVEVRRVRLGRDFGHHPGGLAARAVAEQDERNAGRTGLSVTARTFAAATA